jgi:hypothetical protein
MQRPPDWIRDVVVARARELGLTKYAVAKLSKVSEKHVGSYFNGQKSMTTERLQHLLKVLGLTLKPTRKAK